MAKTTKYETELIKAITKHKWMRWDHIEWLVLSFSRSTAYNHNLHELDTIKHTFEQNRSKGVNYLLNKWIASDNATLNIAAMKLIANDTDRRRLDQQYIEQDHKFKDGLKIEFKKFNNEG